MAKIRIFKDGQQVVEAGLDPLEHASFMDNMANICDGRGRPKAPPDEMEAYIQRNVTSQVGSALFFKVFGESLSWAVNDRDGQLIGILSADNGSEVVDLVEVTHEGIMISVYRLDWVRGGEPRESLTTRSLERTEKSLLTQNFVLGKAHGESS